MGKKKTEKKKNITGKRSGVIDFFGDPVEQQTPDPKEHVVATQREVAEFFDKGIRTIKDWAADGMPGESGNYSLKQIVAWKLDKQQRDKDKDKDVTPDKWHWEVEHKEAKAKIARLEYDLKIGELIKRSDVERQWVDIAQAFKQALVALPERVAPQVVGREIKKVRDILTHRVNEIMDNLATLAGGRTEFLQEKKETEEPKKTKKKKKKKSSGKGKKRSKK